MVVYLENRIPTKNTTGAWTGRKVQSQSRYNLGCLAKALKPNKLGGICEFKILSLIYVHTAHNSYLHCLNYLGLYLYCLFQFGLIYFSMSSVFNYDKCVIFFKVVF